MRKSLIATLVLGGWLTAGSLPAGAVPLGTPNALNAAAEDVALTESVHCTPGWRHHYPTRWRRANGCPRYYRRGAVVVFPHFAFAPRFHRHRFHGHRWYGHRRVYRRW
jgi:hypothetical protein